MTSTETRTGKAYLEWADEDVLGARTRVLARRPSHMRQVLEAEGSGCPLPPVAVESDDPLVIVFTSGTTGPAKGAVLSNRAHIRMMMQAVPHGAVGAILEPASSGRPAGPDPASPARTEHPGGHLDLRDMQDWVGAALARFKMAAMLDVVESLPHEAAGKVMKNLLRDPGANAAGSEEE